MPKTLIQIISGNIATWSIFAVAQEARITVDVLDQSTEVTRPSRVSVFNHYIAPSKEYSIIFNQ